MTTNPISNFERNIKSVRLLHELHKYLTKQITAIDLSEILRAELVLIVSALDCYIHDAVRNGMIEIFEGKLEPNKKFEAYSIPISFVKELIQATSENEKKQIMSAAIKKIASKDSYQSSRSIENALQLISLKGIWSLIKNDMGISPKDIKDTLGLIIHRRNKIAHEADLDRITGIKTEIERSDLDDIFIFIENLVQAIDKQIKILPTTNA